MNWFKKLMNNPEKKENKDSADKVNYISDIELKRIYKIAVVSAISSQRYSINLSSFNFDKKDFIFRTGLFLVEPKYGASSEFYICPDIKDLIPTEIGHSSVLDMKGNGVNVRSIEIPKDIALSILYDENIGYGVKEAIIMKSFSEYMDSYLKSKSRNGLKRKIPLEETLFMEKPEFLELILYKLATKGVK